MLYFMHCVCTAQRCVYVYSTHTVYCRGANQRRAHPQGRGATGRPLVGKSVGRRVHIFRSYSPQSFQRAKPRNFKRKRGVVSEKRETTKVLTTKLK